MSGNLDSVLSKVRSLVSKAEHESTPPHEADACRAMADSLMLKYAITEAMAEFSRTAESRTKPISMQIEIGPDSDVIGYISWLTQEIAKHCRCKVRSYTSYTNGSWNAKVYGFESDVRYFEMMYTTIRLHMLGILLPRVSLSESLEDNCYRLHNAGYNWLQIADRYGWIKWNPIHRGEFAGSRPPEDMKVPYWNKDEGWKPSTYVGSRYKRAYHRACIARGESVQVIAANGTNTYRKSAADGYVGMIARRLAELSSNKQAGSEIILRSRINDVEALFREENPDMFREASESDAQESTESTGKKKRTIKYKPAPFNRDAYQRGAGHARAADLHGNSRMDNVGTKSIGGTN
jgi:Protein of unknown function (DUF2786)